MRTVIAIYVENKYGVLARVAGLFMRKGFNIDSLTVGKTHDPDFSRITITLNGDDYVRTQIVNQLKKLHNVKAVKLLEPGTRTRVVESKKHTAKPQRNYGCYGNLPRKNNRLHYRSNVRGNNRRIKQNKCLYKGNDASRHNRNLPHRRSRT